MTEPGVSRLNEAEAAMLSMDHTKYEAYIDISSFVNYYIFEEVIKILILDGFLPDIFIRTEDYMRVLRRRMSKPWIFRGSGLSTGLRDWMRNLKR